MRMVLWEFFDQTIPLADGGLKLLGLATAVEQGIARLVAAELEAQEKTGYREQYRQTDSHGTEIHDRCQLRGQLSGLGGGAESGKALPASSVSALM